MCSFQKRKTKVGSKMGTLDQLIINPGCINNRVLFLTHRLYWHSQYRLPYFCGSGLTKLSVAVRTKRKATFFCVSLSRFLPIGLTQAFLTSVDACILVYT